MAKELDLKRLLESFLKWEFLGVLKAPIIKGLKDQGFGWNGKRIVSIEPEPEELHNDSECNELTVEDLKSDFDLGRKEGRKEAIEATYKWLKNRYDRQGYLDLDDLDDCKNALEK